MSLLHNLQENNIPNTNKLQPAKQFGVVQLSSKKKALSDVKNTFHQKAAQNDGKPSFTPRKIVNEGQVTLGIFNDKENNICNSLMSKPCDTKFQISNDCSALVSNELDNESIVTCTCEESIEDDYADSFLKNLLVTKDAIENLALNWENKPVVSAQDIQEILVPDAIKYEVDPWMNDDVELDLGSLQVDLAIFKIPCESFDLLCVNDYDSGIGL